jgi:hypothetical protein
MAANELCAGVAAAAASAPVQQHMAEQAVRQQQQEQDPSPATSGRSYPRPDPAAIPVTPPVRK